MERYCTRRHCPLGGRPRWAADGWAAGVGDACCRTRHSQDEVCLSHWDAAGKVVGIFDLPSSSPDIRDLCWSTALGGGKGFLIVKRGSNGLLSLKYNHNVGQDLLTARHSNSGSRTNHHPRRIGSCADWCCGCKDVQAQLVEDHDREMANESLRFALDWSCYWSSMTSL